MARFFATGGVVCLVTLITAAAGAVEPIVRAGTIIQAPGRYKLQNDIVFGDNFEAHAILIKNTSDVHIDLDGKQILGPGGRTAFVAGIIIQNCENVEIDGSDATIGKCRQGVRIERSVGVNIDGGGLVMAENAMDVDVYDSTDVRMDDISSQASRIAALNFADSKDIRVVRCMLKGPGETGVIVSRCERTLLEQVGIGGELYFKKAGVTIDRGSVNTSLSLCSISNCRVGVALGDGVRETQITGSTFGDPKKNEHDLFLGFTAERPILSGNTPEEIGN